MKGWNQQELHKPENDQGNVVIRNEDHSKQDATVSFGSGWSKTKYANVLDVVNYYNPNLQNQLYLPENSFVTSNGKLKGHMGGESTFRGDPMSNRNKQVTTRTNDYLLYKEFNDAESKDSDGDTVVPESRTKGLFEVPFDVYSMPRLIAPFKGFSKIITPRAVRFMTFTVTEENKLFCRVDKNALNSLQKLVSDLEVVSTSFVGDPKSGKSFLASLLVGKNNTSFNVSESFIDPNNMLTNGAVWMYIAVYQEKYAYVFLDFEGFEHCEKSRVKMLLFAFSLSNLVFCNVKYSLVNGIHNSISAMIELTKTPNLNEPLVNHGSLEDEENVFLQIIKDKGTRLLSQSYESQNFNELVISPDDSDNSEVERRELWNAPIVQFVFRDCSGFVKCVDDRIFTPETLVEQGIFEKYLDIFSTNENNPKFKNEMLDSFEVFTNRKYLSLPHPTLSTHPYSDNDYSEDETLNLTDFFMKLLSSDKHDFKNFKGFGYDDFTLNTNLSSIFYEKLDQLKSLLYHDTLNYAMAHPQLNGRMFGEYVKKLAYHFNKNNSVRVDDLNDILSSVFFGENTNLLKESLIRFLKHVRAKIAPKLPVDSKELLNMALSAKFTSLNYFESNAFGTLEEYKDKLNELSETLEELIRKLENKNKSLMTIQLANYVDKKEALIRCDILKGKYTVNDLDNDLTKLKNSLNAKFSDSQLVTKVLARSSQNLVRVFNDTHPEVFIHNLNYLKTSSIEEVFQSLNTDITSLTSNLHLSNENLDHSLYNGQDYSSHDSEEESQSDKLDTDREDNNLDEEYEDSFEDSELRNTSQEEQDYENTINDEDDLGPPNELNDSNDESFEQEQQPDSQQELTKPTQFIESSVEDVEGPSDTEDGVDDSDTVEDDNVDEYEEESDSTTWLLGESGGTRSFRDDIAEFSDDEEESESMEEEEGEDFDVNDTQAVLKEIFENSANEFTGSKGTKEAL